MGAQYPGAYDYGAEQQKHAKNVGVQHRVAEQDSDKSEGGTGGAEG